ncbi:MAG: SDR family NAD(P)-dependent oxidoreductase [Anaerolineae bacterium]
MSVVGKVALITGATGALGTVVSHRFQEEGAQLVLCDIAEEPLHALGRELGDPPCLVSRTDVTDAKAIQRLVEKGLEQFGRIDILLNIAGGYRGGRIAELSEEDLEFALSLNLKSTFLTCRAVAPHMTAQGWGRIVNVGARAGLGGTAGNALHAISKGGVILLTEALAKEVRDHGVTANVVIPSTLDTPANREAFPNAEFAKWVPPEHIAETMLFICSQEAGSINGARITVFNRT